MKVEENVQKNESTKKNANQPKSGSSVCNVAEKLSQTEVPSSRAHQSGLEVSSIMLIF